MKQHRDTIHSIYRISDFYLIPFFALKRRWWSINLRIVYKAIFKRNRPEWIKLKQKRAIKVAFGNKKQLRNDLMLLSWLLWDLRLRRPSSWTWPFKMLNDSSFWNFTSASFRTCLHGHQILMRQCIESEIGRRLWNAGDSSSFCFISTRRWSRGELCLLQGAD